MNTTPYGNRLLIKKIDASPVVSAGVQFTTSTVYTGEVAKVVLAGDDCTKVKVGAKIIFETGKGKGINIEGDNYHTLLEHEIMFYENPTADEAVEKSF